MKTNLSAFVIFIIAFCTANGQKVLNVGDKAPDFHATADDGSTWNIKNFLGKDYIVVYFYPAAMTGGCTKEACAYRDHRDNLNAAGVVVVGVSGDNIVGLKLFRHAENLNFPLLSDEKGKIAEKFGVPLSEGGSIKRTVDGKEYELVHGVTAKRWTFIIDKEGKIIYKNESVNPEKDPEEVLAFIKNQSSR
jgi:thioredoxin-dependent peroxiredoxin